MTINSKTLTKGWIEFLKNNQMVELQSDPKTGNLKYRKKVTVTDLMRYLENTTDFDEKTIRRAITAALGAEPSPEPTAGKLSTDKSRQNQLSAPAPKQLSAPVQRKDDGVTDVEYRDINEDIVDNPGYVLDEPTVEEVFRILAKPAPKAVAVPPEEPVDQKAIDEKRFADLNKIKRLIRDTMSEPQRKMLWRALTDA